MTQKPTLLVADIGGTNARFALADPERPAYHDAATLQCAEFPSVEAAIARYLQDTGAPAPDVVCLAAAGPVVGDAIAVTNNHWRVSAAEVGDEFDVSQVRLLNDFEAVAFSIPFIDDNGSVAVGLPDPRPLGDSFNVAILGPGTGLGIAGLYGRDGQLVTVSGEGGHIGFAPESQVQIDILQVLRSQFERVSAERLLSGSGVENIYAALCAIHGEKRTRETAAAIFADAAEDARAAETVAMFFDVLGQVAGDLALTLGATDGVFIAGGITKRYPELLQKSGFRNAFESKGRHRAYMERIPTRLITYDEPGLLGAAYCALEMLSASSS